MGVQTAGTAAGVAGAGLAGAGGAGGVLAGGGLGAARLGDPPGTVPPTVAGGVLVQGGIGGTTAVLGSLTAAANHTERAARSLANAAECVRRAAAAVRAQAFSTGGDPWSGGSTAAAQAAPVLAAVNAGPGGLFSCADRASGLGRALRAAATGYAEADDDARRRLAATVLLVSGWVGDGGPALWSALGLVSGAAAGVWAFDVALWRSLPWVAPWPVGELSRRVPDLSGLPGPLGWLAGPATRPGGLVPDGSGLPHGAEFELALLGLAAFVMGAQPGPWVPSGHPVPQVAGQLSLATTAWTRLLGRRTEVLVAPLIESGAGAGAAAGGGRGRAAERPPSGVSDVLAQVAERDAAAVPTVGVQRLDHADGTTGWVVAIPGTRSMDVLPGPVPMDNATNLALMAGLPDDMTAAVESAMLQAGVGPDDPVLLAGHSQGGMVATRLASRLGDTFRIEALVTAGSPVGTMPVPDGVTALHLEHAQDWGPGLDGWQNPAAPNRTTVVRDLPGLGTTWGGSDLGLMPTDLGRAHDAWGYVHTGAVVDALDDPSVQGFRDAFERVVGDGTAQVTDRTYVVTRVPDAKS